MTYAAVDTNVLVVANGAAPQASAACRLAVVRELAAIQEEEAAVFDESGEMFLEYGKHCSRAGQPGVGDEFFRWAWENQHRLTIVALTAHDERRYEEFPDAVELAAFDWDDRVFVAVALAAPDDCEVVNAVDSDYQEGIDALAAAGVLVKEMCGLH